MSQVDDAADAEEPRQELIQLILGAVEASGASLALAATLPLCLSVSLSLCLSVSLSSLSSLSLCLSTSGASMRAELAELKLGELQTSLSLPLCLSVLLCLSVSVPLCLCASVSLCVSVCVSVCLYFSLSVSLSLQSSIYSSRTHTLFTHSVALLGALQKRARAAGADSDRVDDAAGLLHTFSL